MAVIVLITVSGLVGSGKSTLGAALASHLSERGAQIDLISFRALPCFQLLKRDDRTSAHDIRRAGSGDAPTRRTHYRRQRLTLLRTLGHVGRILSFRTWHLCHRRDGLVLNRYFYDSFSHYDLDGTFARLWLGVIHFLMPSPDLAILVEADLETLARRRPNYARPFLETAASAYAALPIHFPELITISSTSAYSDEVIDRLLARLDRSPR